MPDVALTIGGRHFKVACDPGQEAELEQAAGLLDTEAQTLAKAIGAVPEPRMLLMAGLMLADRTRELARRVQAAEIEAEDLRAQLGTGGGTGSTSDGGDAEALAVLETVAARLEALAQN
ncbi:MAG: cell division protein ZapA [Pseudomonadota bacterium]